MVTRLRGVRGTLTSVSADVQVVPATEGALEQLPRLLKGPSARGLAARVRTAGFRARPDETLVHRAGDRVVILVGLGAAAPSADGWRRVGARGRREAEREGARRVSYYLGASAGLPECLSAVAEGALLVGYRFDRYRSEPGRSGLEQVILVGEAMPAPAVVGRILGGVEELVATVFSARDTVNEPPSVGTPRFLAEHARKLAAGRAGLTIEVWDERRIVREGLAGLAAVARGSEEPPRFIRARYRPRGAKRRVALVGKGITFDSGGLSLKPAASMETQKSDMAGAAAVLSAAAAAATLALPIEVTAFVSATENLPSGRAQKPGDIIRYANGKSVEVVNTDAEGRLILADLLILASREKPDAVIDLATLTGSARVALGNLYGGLFGSDQATIDALVAAGKATGEPVWPMPLVREYRDDIRSTVADLKNQGGALGGMITAALFLSEFVDGVPWAHLDIAGPAFAEKEAPYAPRGGTGYGVRLLVEYLRQLAAG